MKEYQVLGLMSGSSLDGLDVCLTVFSESELGWSYDIMESITFEYPEALLKRLRASIDDDPHAWIALDEDYGEWIAEQIEIYTATETIDLITVHGHTVKHTPTESVSIQLGNPQIIANHSGIPCVGDFRSKDVKLGGQGAPLVPVGEYYLFQEFPGFINFGGICNITQNKGLGVQAWDLGPFNQVFDFYANLLNAPFDRGGELSKSGKLDQDLYTRWSQLDFFQRKPPKSLDNSWVKTHFLSKNHEPKAAMRTFCELMSDVLARTLLKSFRPEDKVLLTGGGAYNTFFIETLKSKIAMGPQLIIPNKQLIEFKEAMIFGFLGLLTSLDRTNVFASVTGASKDSVSGAIYSPEV